jgi:hypothetical protein
VATVLAWINVVALLGVGGLFTLYSLIPFAMANDSPRCGPLLRHGVLQLAGLAGLAASVLLGAFVAHRATTRDGWAAVGFGAAGWGAWIGGVVLTMGLFFAVSALDTAAAERRRARRGQD